MAKPRTGSVCYVRSINYESGNFMSHIILHHKGRYNVYSTIADAPLFDNSMSLDEFKEETGKVFGHPFLRTLIND